MNKSESKYFATAARMDEAFLELIEKKDFAYITVKEICEKAGVNRSTFYLHYERWTICWKNAPDTSSTDLWSSCPMIRWNF